MMAGATKATKKKEKTGVRGRGGSNGSRRGGVRRMGEIGVGWVRVGGGVGGDLNEAAANQLEGHNRRLRHLTKPLERVPLRVEFGRE